MDNLPFFDGELDVIWSEGAIYNIGFEKGVAEWRRFLKAGGLLVASEITWLTDSRPSELQKYWDSEYPEIDVASAKIRVLEKHGYSPIGYFVLPEHCWLDEYYRPMQARFDDFLNRNGNSQEVREIVTAEQREIDLYETYKAYISYGVYVARKTEQKANKAMEPTLVPRAADGWRSADRGRSSERGPRLSATCSSAYGGRTRGSNGRACGPPLSRGPR
jgi:SAM-dependent methyltransferase